MCIGRRVSDAVGGDESIGIYWGGGEVGSEGMFHSLARTEPVRQRIMGYFGAMLRVRAELGVSQLCGDFGIKETNWRGRSDKPRN